MNTIREIRVDDGFGKSTTQANQKIYSTDDVRQGDTLGVMRYVLSISMLLTIIAFMAKARSIDRISALLFIPYLAWVGFASLLNLSIAWLN